MTDKKYQDEIDTIEAKIESLRNHSLSDEKAEELSRDIPQKDPRDIHERHIVAVSYEGNGEIDVGGVTKLAGNENIRWKDKVYGTFGAAPETPDGIRESYREAKARWIHYLSDERNRYLNARRMDVPVWDAPATEPPEGDC
ncbi:hypothetical protein [Haloarchaeobius litoreus]|uniref:Uncharacterized protein n=1 Tax=Haloarchaeobius litoreus TaxID=755306 RepID=A0ABD6DMW7_9EURY|nr:hypothetical protein [Haloarchaeobius litoreus]